jgi:CubicO group peptidase (beta-lactamase class C family)
VRVDTADDTWTEAYGFAHRALEVPNTPDTRFGVASGVKGLTALTVASVIADGRLALETPARSLLGDDLLFVPADVTVEHLLSHRSGIGDYLDEEAGFDASGYVLPVPAHELVATEDYLRVLDGHTSKFRAGERFAYCNSGYVLLALLAERAGGAPFHELVHERVCEPAGLVDTAFLRSDELPGRTALGYVDAQRTNVFHLPVRGSGDGGVYTTVADVRSLWTALFAGRIVGEEWVRELMRPRSDGIGKAGLSYGLGFWLLPRSGAAMLEGADAGVSFRSIHEPRSGATCTVVSNTSDGAWPIARRILTWFEERGDTE